MVWVWAAAAGSLGRSRGAAAHQSEGRVGPPSSQDAEAAPCVRAPSGTPVRDDRVAHTM